MITRFLYYNLQCSVLIIYKNYKYPKLLKSLLLICNHNIIIMIIEALQSFALSPACVYYYRYYIYYGMRTNNSIKRRIRSLNVCVVCP